MLYKLSLSASLISLLCFLVLVYLGLLLYTVKNIGGEKTLVNYNITPSCFINFHNFHYIPIANELQFTKVVSAKLPTVLICQIKFFTVRYSFHNFPKSLLINYILNLFPSHDHHLLILLIFFFKL